MRDIGSALLDKQGRMITIGNYMPAHTAGVDIGILQGRDVDMIRVDDKKVDI